jgi:hypothetical protein
VGYEEVDGINTPMYYTELNLSFEIQGPPAAISTVPYAFQKETGSIDSGQCQYKINTSIADYTPSHLPIPVEVEFLFKPLVAESDTNDEYKYFIKSSAYYEDETLEIEETVDMFSFTLEKITHYKDEDEDSAPTLIFRYNSETGLMYVKYGNLNEKLLTLQTLTDLGERMVSSFTSNKFVIPGLFTSPEFDMDKLKFKFQLQKWNKDPSDEE